tara:strand:- start:286 stop:510 length:225 start_codon:yes stop_codon:yes gene_type:complete
MGGSSQPAAPPAAAPPAPPAATNLVSAQASPSPTDEASRSSQETGTTITAKKKGKKALKIDLVASGGSGVQTGG